MNGFTSVGFAEPWLLAALVLPVLAVIAFWSARARRRAAALVLGGPLALRGGPERLRLAVAVLVTLALALAVVAAARPQWGVEDEAVPQRGIDLVIALDVSRSMEAEDVLPDRASAAAGGLTEMLTHLTGNRVGLVTFAGDAFLRAPLTVDLGVVASLVNRAQSESPLVSPGTNYRDALAQSFAVLDVEDRAATQAVLLVSDGEDLDEEFADAVAFAERRGIRVYTVFAGTTNPTPLPQASGGTDVSVARPEVLEEIASTTGASFRTTEQLPGLAVEIRRLQQTQFEDADQTRPVDRFAWFAGAAALLLVLGVLAGDGATRLPRLRGGAITAALAAFLAVVVAGCGAAAWSHVEAGNDAYETGDFEAALAEYREAADAQPEDAIINGNIAGALHQLGRFEEAAASAQQSRDLAEAAGDGETAARALFTAGNTAFARQDFEAARDAYRSVLRIDPTDQDAKANLELVMAALTPPQPPPGEAPDEGEGEGEAGEGDPGEGGGEGEGEQTPTEPGDQPTEQPGEGEGEGEGTGEPADPGQQPGEGAPSGSPEGPVAPSDITTLEDAQAALAEALGELGPEVSLEEALRILELARRANELDALPSTPGGGAPPR